MALALMSGMNYGNDNDKDDNLSRKETGVIKSTKVHKVSIPHDPEQTIDVYSWFEITVTDINVPEQTFQVSIECYVFWQEYGFPEVFPNFADDLFKIDDDDVPVKLSEVFENKIAHDFSEDVSFKYHAATSCMQMSWISEATFVERMELQKFPLDRQFLNMQFNAWINTDKVKWNWILTPPEWVPSEYHKPICVRMVSSITEYELLSPWIEFDKQEPPLTLRLRVDRLPQYYFGNVVLPNFLIVAACFSCFVIPPSEVSDRLSITVTLMLAAVAFRFVISTMLPKVNYLTYMDYYILLGFVALTILIAENAIAGISYIGEDGAKYLDYTFAVGFGFSWIAIHITSLGCLISRSFLRLSWEQMDELDKAEDPADEFTKADPNDVKGKQESENNKKRWENFKLKSPMSRANEANKNIPNFSNLNKVNENEEMDEIKLDKENKPTTAASSNNNNDNNEKQQPRKISKEERTVLAQIELNEAKKSKPEPEPEPEREPEHEPEKQDNQKSQPESNEPNKSDEVVIDFNTDEQTNQP